MYAEQVSAHLAENAELSDFLSTRQLALIVTDSSNWANYSPFIAPKLCDREFISESYESLVYESIEYIPSLVGIFAIERTAEHNLVASLVIDLAAEAAHWKIKKAAVDLSAFAEISLLCSDPRHRVPGLAHALMTAVHEALAQMGKPNTVLWVGSIKTENTNAAEFYRRLGYMPIPSNTGGLWRIAKTGGRRRHRSRRKNAPNKSSH